MTQIIALSNHKGGVGKTTTAVNLGHELQAAGHSVLVVELDKQCNLASVAGLGKKLAPELTVNRLLLTDDELGSSGNVLDAIHETPWDVPLVPANKALSQTENHLGQSDTQNPTARLKRGLSQLLRARPFDFVLLDCPPAQGRMVGNALQAADWVIVVAGFSRFDIDGLPDTLDLIRRAQEWNEDLRVLGVLPTRVEKRTKLAQDVSRDLEKNMPGALQGLLPSIHKSTAVEAAIDHGHALRQEDRQHKVARDYRKLARVVIERTSGLQLAEAAA